MLDFIYYPVSWILWVWHKVFSFVLAPDSGWAWALSVVFLVFTLRAILYKPFVKQVRTTRQMQELQPQIKALQKKYAKDRQRQALEMQKLQKEHGFNPLMGCLPVLLQVPVFIGLFHVLRSFNRTGTGVGQLGLSPEQNAQLGNYAFSPEDVQSFLSARLFGAPISSWITQPMASLEAFEPFGGIPTRWQIAAVAVPLMIVAGIATHFNARASVSRQSAQAAANPQAAIMNKLALYVFPLGVLVGGPFLPIAVIIYWVSNNIWTYGQQHLVFRRIDKEEGEKKAAALARRNENAPKPGARPDKSKKKGSATAPDALDASVDETGEVSLQKDSAAGDESPAASKSGASTPKPGSRPKNSKRKRR
ncbi:inner membrane protein translocase component YidC [Rhodococcus rhodochrous]|uniref:Membrane protein insertase YidC n=1 Tax=Rhodococcus rhodochrous TaxID=1829 RepID=A0AA47ABF0_RHORH|nr:MULTISPECIES: membrane protein insertase YidC [Rhodococcus]MCD2097693.1 membrane protein insertase YidC [Rhodococcus rhodochrous]MCD2122006.1 membrane protein insertase YidC [Rhodococcus rhodochrous]MCQ4135019.1 membrane protein insertase YidC [Rhodococcus rhodochrous]MDC3724603.1 membrane protein insertase YidC [Rhodococcus sp. Rp3]MDJ0018870.1 membrane protein insertase YidC [Rhodococcus rhodochrous]